jgi:hypothetical protein
MKSAGKDPAADRRMDEFKQLQAVVDQRDRLRAERDALRKIVKTLEWTRFGIPSAKTPDAWCQICSEIGAHGHAPDCAIAKVLKP